MAERLDSNAVIEAIRDGFARASTEKQVLALADSVKSALATVEERVAKIDTRLKAFESALAENAELDRKEHVKTRTHVTDQVEMIDVGDSEGAEEAIDKTVGKYAAELKGMVKFLIGDDPETIGAVRSKFRDWIGKKGKKALLDSQEE